MTRTQFSHSCSAKLTSRIAALSIGVLFTASLAFGQVATGFPPFSSIAPSSFDSVNYANLNVLFQIPVFNKAGRGGHPFSFVLGYNSAVWTPQSSGGSGFWAPAASWGWGSGSTANNGVLVATWNLGTCTDYVYTTFNWDQWTYTAYIDPYGTSHPIGSTSAGLTVSDYATSGADCYGDSYPNTINTTTSDGAGYTIVTESFSDGGGFGNYGTANVYSRSGDLFSNPFPASWGYTSGQVQYADGNVEGWSASGSTVSYYDTLGAATAVTATGSTSSVTYQYTGPSGSTYTYTAYYTSKTVRTNFGCSGIAEFGPSSQYLLTEIDLPDIGSNSNDKYTFTYEPTYGYSGDTTGRLASVKLPTGGTISYSYGTSGVNGITCADGSSSTMTRATPDGTWTYAHTENTSTTWTTTITDPTSSSNQTVVNFVVPTNGNPLETKRQIYSGSSGSGTLMKTVDTCYNGSSLPCPTTAVTLPISSTKVEVTMPSLSASETSTTYNSYGLPTETDEFNFGPSLVRKTIITYNMALNSDYIYDHPSEVKVENSSSTPVADSTYSYDSYGNLTGTTLSTGGTPSTISRSVTYAYSGAYGVVTASTDFNSNSTGYSSGTCSPLNAFPTSISLPGSLSMSVDWNCNAALPSSITDPNGNQTTFTYDSMVRTTGVSFPDGGSVSTPSPTSTTQQNINTAVTASLTKEELLDLDGLGRTTTHALVNDPGGETYVATTYDAAGRVASVSNPYRGSSTGGDSYTYDALSRVTKVTHADSSYSQTAYGTNSQNCSSSTYGYGYSTLSSDEVGNQRQIFTDFLGRVIEADEPTSSSNSLTVYTCYQYDALNDLTEVVQGSETRTYAYDMLGRLTQSTTPEGKGNSKYFYYTTSGGSLCSGSPSAVCRRTDERSITTTYTYDALNRPTGMTYSNSDPSVTYSYDQSSYNGLTIANGKGLRTGMSDGSGETAWSFDSMGRAVAEERKISSLTETLSYGYNLDGSPASITYPSGRTITYTPSAVGRLVSAEDTTNSINYVTNATYAVNGGLAGADFGSNITFTGSFDTHRLWPTLFQGSTTSPSATFFELEPSWNTNGTVSGVTNALTSGRTQSFTYDYLNRIITGQSTATSGTYCWGQGIPTNGTGYDRYGNLLTVNSTQCSAPTLSLSANTYNQITNSGFTYDASGNMTHDASYSYTWNGENELTGFGGTSYYTYDGDHKRVENSYNGYYYWYSPDGLPLAETNSSGTTQNEYIYFNGARVARRDSSGNVYYYFSNQTGSTNLMTTSSGTVCFDADRTPFGYEMDYTTTCSQNYNYAGMELDGGTGNYHTWFRQYEPNLGRWMSPDLLGGDVTNPQSLNLYSYVLNNPGSLVDPLGLGPASDACAGFEAQFGWFDCIGTGSGESGGGGGSIDCELGSCDGDWGGGEGGGGGAGGGGGGSNADVGGNDTVVCSTVSGKLTCTASVTGNPFPWPLYGFPITISFAFTIQHPEKLERAINCTMSYYGFDPANAFGLASNTGKAAAAAATVGGVPKTWAQSLGWRVLWLSSKSGPSDYTSLLSMLSQKLGGGVFRTLADTTTAWTAPVAVTTDVTAIRLCTALDQ